MKYSDKQKPAYHEAAHVVALLRYNIPFVAVHLALGEGTDALGSVALHPSEPYLWAGKQEGNNFLSVLLAGLCASKIMAPHKSYEQIVHDGTAYGDWLKSRQFLKIHYGQIQLMQQVKEGKTAGFETKEITDSAADLVIWHHLRTVRRFVKYVIGPGIFEPDEMLVFDQI